MNIPKLSLNLAKVASTDSIPSDSNDTSSRSETDATEIATPVLLNLVPKLNLSLPSSTSTTTTTTTNISPETTTSLPGVKIPPISIQNMSLQISSPSPQESNSITPHSSAASSSSSRVPFSTSSIPNLVIAKPQQIQVDLVVSKLCTLPCTTDSTQQIQKIQEQVQQLFFPKHSKNNNKVEFDILPLNEYKYICLLKNEEITFERIQSIVEQNEALKIRLQKTANALEYFEKENERLEQTLQQQQQPITVPNLIPSVTSANETVQEIESLKAKLQKHEQLRAEMIRTVESLKKQHQLLTQAILQQNNDVNMESDMNSIKPLNLSGIKLNSMEEKLPITTTSTQASTSVPSLKLNFGSLKQQSSTDDMEE